MFLSIYLCTILFSSSKVPHALGTELVHLWGTCCMSKSIYIYVWSPLSSLSIIFYHFYIPFFSIPHLQFSLTCSPSPWLNFWSCLFAEVVVAFSVVFNSVKLLLSISSLSFANWPVTNSLSSFCRRITLFISLSLWITTCPTLPLLCWVILLGMYDLQQLLLIQQVPHTWTSSVPRVCS